MTEAQIRVQIKKYLKRKGYIVLDFSSERRMPAGLKYAPDLFVFLPDCTMLIECKTPTNSLSTGQLEWMIKLHKFAGPHLVYICAHSLLEVQDEITHLQQST